MNFLITILILILPSCLFANETCFIDTYEQIVTISNNNSVDDIIKFSDCSLETQNTFNKLISQIDGKISNHVVTNWFGTSNVKIKPEIISVTQLDKFIKNSLNLNASLIIKEVKSLTGIKSLKFENQDSLKIDCTNCNSTGEKNFKISHVVNNQIFSSWWFSAKILESTKGIVSLKEIPSFVKSISTDYVKEEMVEADTSKNLVKDINVLKYFKPIRQIPPHKILEMSDLKPINLVEMNAKVDLILKSNDVEIKTTAIAKSNGTFGETVDVLNPKTNKRIQAKIIDINKVTVNL
jgi:flagella basal body P-ring formation protein FlgA